MTRKTSGYSKKTIMLKTAIISLVIVVSTLTSFSESNSRMNTDKVINQMPKQSSIPTSLVDLNQTNRVNVAYFELNFSISPSIAAPILEAVTNEQPDLTQDAYDAFAFLAPQIGFTFPDNRNQGQMAESDATPQTSVTYADETGGLDVSNSYINYPSAPLNAAPLSLNPLQFATYTYGGYPVQQPDQTQLIFSFPNSTNQGQLAGSDAITLNTHSIQKMEFDSVFITPKISAFGFDEMVIFAASDASTYNGTEFGIRLDLNDGFIYGYIQEPNGIYGKVDFLMQRLIPNDGIMHHYSVTMLGSEVKFCIDGMDCGYLNFSDSTEYSGLSFSILAVVHRFTDDWDSVGDNMIVENFILNQQ